MDSLAIRIPPLLCHESGKYKFVRDGDSSVSGCIFMGSEIRNVKSWDYPYRYVLRNRSMCDRDARGTPDNPA